jgi:hypothetical protein
MGEASRRKWEARARRALNIQLPSKPGPRKRPLFSSEEVKRMVEAMRMDRLYVSRPYARANGSQATSTHERRVTQSGALALRGEG